MRVLQGRDVNALWFKGLNMLVTQGIRANSRAGEVLVMDTPVTSVYDSPTSRVLLDPARDANPFFHLMESLWMLAGRDDPGFLNKYVKDFGARFAEDPENYIHGAYGHRWRHIDDFDQLDVIVDKLRKNPDDRQCVLQMWDCLDAMDLTGEWRDRPCNTHCYVRVRQTDEGVRGLFGNEKALDLTICCRSNDIVWGAYGANAVHFSVLQEYLAGRIGVRVGRMYQVSNNYHGYVDVLNKMVLSRTRSYPLLETTPIGTDWGKWDEDLKMFMEWHDGTLWYQGHGYKHRLDYANTWFASVASHVAAANYLRATGDHVAALEWANLIQAEDWRVACTEWLKRRIK